MAKPRQAQWQHRIEMANKTCQHPPLGWPLTCRILGIHQSNSLHPMTASPHMLKALNIASQAMRITSPNPRVGCVIVNSQGKILGQGHTQKAGGLHAEMVALQDAANQGNSVEGATVYVTLEPCAHHGRTAPCCDALIKAKIGKVVAALSDPNPLVAGQGLDRHRPSRFPGATGARRVRRRVVCRLISADGSSATARRCRSRHPGREGCCG